jgi:hypothetical protein
MAQRGVPAPHEALERLSFDPELQAIAARSYPSDGALRERARLRDLENLERRRHEVRDLRELVWRAIGGVYGPRVRDRAREIICDGAVLDLTRPQWRSRVAAAPEIQLGAVAKLVRRWCPWGGSR